MILPAQAQFWDWGRPRRFEPFRDWWAPPRYEPRYRERERDSGGWEQREAPADFSRAPPPAQKKPEATISIVVMGDGNADWLASGLEEAYSEKPEIAVVRKNRTDSGLIRYDPRRDSEWPQIAREILAAEKPKFVVMMVGNNDRQAIREKAPPVVRPGAPKPNNPQSPPQAGQPTQPTQPTQATPAPALPAQTDAEQHAGEGAAAEQPPVNMSPEQARLAAYGPWEFHSEKWEAAYVKRIDATISALKSAGVPVIWVGLPSQRNTKPSADSAYLNELYRSRAEKAGITYVDVWDGFVDEGGRFSPQGPDYEGQIRRLRTGDGVYFTKFGARKLAHYVDKEIQRYLANRPAIPVALPMPAEPEKQAAKPGAPAQPGGGASQRPSVGPVVPLTVNTTQPEELVGGGRTAPKTTSGDATATRVLNRGEPVPAPRGRADDFSWPRSGIEIDQSALEPTPPSPPGTPSLTAGRSGTPAAGQQAENTAGEQKPIQRRLPREGFRAPSLQQIFPFFRF
jgi:hypothetical protein